MAGLSLRLGSPCFYILYPVKPETAGGRKNRILFNVNYPSGRTLPRPLIRTASGKRSSVFLESISYEDKRAVFISSFGPFLRVKIK